MAALIAGCGGGKQKVVHIPPPPGEPSIDIVSPRNGARQSDPAVVVRVKLHNFRLSPAHFGGEPLLAEGNIHFSLNRVPNCVNPARLQRALANPIGKGRLIGPSFDYPRYSGPNGILAARVGSLGVYSPATRPEIYYHNLEPGFYRLVITLAQNSGTATPYHAVTNFQVLSASGQGSHQCTGGKVPATQAEAAG